SDHLAEPANDLPRERLWQGRAKRGIIPTGGLERPMGVAHNDPPGIMLGSGARPHPNPHGAAAGTKNGASTPHDAAYAAALDLKKAGVGIAAIVDLRDNPTGPLVDAVRAENIEIHHGRAVIRAGGRLRVSSMTVQAKGGGPERTIPVDAI